MTWDGFKGGEQKKKMKLGVGDFFCFERRIGGSKGTCNRKPEILFWYNTNFKCYFGIFFNKTWGYVVTWIDVFNNIEKHKLLQWILCSSFMWIFCCVKLWWNEL